MEVYMQSTMQNEYLNFKHNETQTNGTNQRLVHLVIMSYQWSNVFDRFGSK